MLKCLIIDDEPNAVSLLELLIAEATDWQVAARCYNGLEALQALKIHTVDFVFLDINMPVLNGMELAALLPTGVKIVFTTAYAEHAAESYLLNAVDYMLKPVTMKRFITAQQKIESAFAQEMLPAERSSLPYPGTGALQGDGLNAQLQAPDSSQHYLFVKTTRGHKKVMLQEILYVEGDKEYVKLVTTTESVTVYRRLKSVEAQLEYPFIRVHNSYIINMEKMDGFFDNHMLIADQRIPLGDKYRAQFMARLNQKLF